MERFLSAAQAMIDRCRALADYTEEPGFTTRTFLSEPMHAVHGCLRAWMERAGMTLDVDHAGNLRGRYAASRPNPQRLYIGSHLDTVPRAGAFDGILGVVIVAAEGHARRAFDVAHHRRRSQHRARDRT
jgi:allantoate deiminase